MARQPWPAQREGRCEGWRIPPKKLIDAAQFIAAAAKGEPKDDGKDAADAAAMFGLVVEEPDEEPDSFGILPENVDALNWFLLMQTQWRVGMNGMTGMDYGVFLQWAKEEGVKRSDRMWLLGDLRMMEGQYLNSLHSGTGSR
jgi:hypothetical protein